MKPFCVSAGQPAHDLEDGSAGQPAYQSPDSIAGDKFFDVSFFRQQVQEAHNMLETEISCAISAKLLPMLNLSLIHI